MELDRVLYPELYICKFSGEVCAKTGCWFDRIIERIQNTAGLGVEKQEEMIATEMAEAKNSQCKKYRVG